MDFFIRKPQLPLLIDTGTELLVATSWSACEKRLAAVVFVDNGPRDVIDATTEGFSLYPEKMLFSPLTFKKRSTKAGIIKLYNDRRGVNTPEYQPKSLGNKSLERVVKDIVELLSAP
jgi:hypothetical protein